MYTKSFEDIFFPIGTTVELPLDIVLPGQKRNYVSFTLPNYDRDADKYILDGIDYIIVPTFDLGGSGKTKEESEKIVIDKIRECSVKVLVTAAKHNPQLIGNSKAHLYALASQFIQSRVNKFSHAPKFHSFKYNNEYIFVDKAMDSCVICVREDVTTFDDPTTGGFYSWAEMGFIVLNSNAVISGVIK